MNILLPLLASVLSGTSAIFEKLSVVTLSGLTVLTHRYLLMAPVLVAAMFLTGAHRELRTIDARTMGTIALPAAMALGSLLLYFTALKSDIVSRVFPLTELGPLVAFLLAALFLNEPFSLQRLLGTILIVAGIFLIR